MKRTLRVDPFFDKQPPHSFLEDLSSPVFSVKPKNYGKRKIEENEIDANGIYIANRFQGDSEGLLETTYDDFKNFIKAYGISGDIFPVFLNKGETECFEAYKISITNDCVNITANDTEGVRRAVIYLEDELRRREGAFLKCTEICRRPIIKDRITRCFFSPINRPPKYGDELYDDVDYYPDEYLNRLMHDGSNAIWIYTHYYDILPSTIIVESGKEYEKRIAKLNKVIDKCARYGIGVYIFAIEPLALTEEQAEKYPKLVGAKYIVPSTLYSNARGGSFCVNSEEGRRYLYEAGKKLIELAPKLKGMISIPFGERATTCLSLPEGFECPVCSKKKKGHLLSDVVDALCAGFREANPEFKYISWTYGSREWPFSDIIDYIQTVPSDVMVMQNFDDRGYEKQLGKVRQCIDYWLSYVGPSEFFKISAEEARRNKKHMYAKMQVCCSHELASVPYIPTPGIIYKKYESAKELGVEGVLQCWYFGNYPSLMSKAAGELSFDDKYESEDEFLKKLAGIYWGRSNADKIVNAWKEFEKAYTKYPMNIMFSYYGPAHDSVVWKLALKPKNFSLPRSWQTVDPIDGDRIGESMLDGHDIDEVVTLFNGMCKHWKKGIEYLSTAETEKNLNSEQVTLASSIDVLFDSARNIMTFYMLREKMGLQQGNVQSLLDEMKELVNLEKINSEKMIDLCKADTRLGYHSEGEGYKFFPEKLEDRINSLDELLNTEFKEVQERIKNGLTPLEFYEGKEDNPSVKTYNMPSGSVENSSWEKINERAKFRMSYDDESIYLEIASDKKEAIVLSPEFRLMWPNADIVFEPDGDIHLAYEGGYYFCLFGEHEVEEIKKYSDITRLDGGNHIIIRHKRNDIKLDSLRPFKIKIVVGDNSWCKEENPVKTLGKPSASPGEYGWIMPIK